MEDTSWTLGRVLKWTTGFFERKGCDSARLDAELLIAHSLSVDRIRLYMDHDKPLAPDELKAIRGLVKRRGEGEPVAYITGSKAFWTIELRVDHRVLIPRPDTEHVVEHSLKALESVPEPRIVDVGCGSGCIALSIASARPDAQVLAIDISADALDVAKENAAHLNLSNVEFRQNDLLENVHGTYDLIVSNPPYIASADIDNLMVSVRDYEPVGALDGGKDGLGFYRRLIPESADLLKPGGHIFFEIGYDQGAALTEMLTRHGGFDSMEIIQDYGGHDRVVKGTRMPFK
jgi:release factor glutamine methyltransferase